MLNSFLDLNDLLNRISVRLQLSQHQYEVAEKRYRDVGEWLAAEESSLVGATPQIYPQGSLKTGTTVKPVQQQEYDLDLICELQLDWRRIDPGHVLKAVQSRLEENNKYAPIIKGKSRCIRLDYPGEFHLDVVPACPALERGNGYLRIPDKEAKGWRDTNPEGYAEWFENQSAMQVFMEKAAAIEPLPEPEPAHVKPPLKRAVQLIKRSRDIFFKERQESAPASILLTTLAAQEYQGQISIKDTLSSIFEGIEKRIAVSKGRLMVFNPANTEEELSERWNHNPDLYRDFIAWLAEVHQLWNDMRRDVGLQKVSKILGQLFGEEVTEYVIEKQAEFVEAARRKQSLKTTSAGLIVTSDNTGKIIAPNTFYGSAE